MIVLKQKRFFLFKLSMSNYTKIFNSERLDFITASQFLAVKDHFENILERIKDDENLKEIAIQFSNLLLTFQTCYMENQRKTQKILELKALQYVKSQRAKSISPAENAVAEDLRKKLKILQRDIDKANNERVKFLKEVEELKKAVDKQNKMIQVHEKSLESIYVDVGISCNLTSYDSKPNKSDDVRGDRKRKDHTEKRHSYSELKKETDSIVTLKNNLEILVLDLKMSRQKIEEIKNKLCEKDALVKKLGKDAFESQKKFAEYETRISDVRKPMETTLTKYKTELRKEKEESKAISEALAKVQLQNKQLGVDISAKESIIDGLEMKLKELEVAKESADRKAEVFERHLARSQNYNKELISEIKTLKDEIQALKQNVSKEVISDKVRSEKEIREEVESLERTIENMKNHIILRDRKLRQAGGELGATVEILQNLRRDFTASSKERSNLQSEIELLKKTLNVKAADMKYLQEKLCEVKKESGEMKRELYSLERKYKQVVAKRDKFHSMYNQIKFVNSQQNKNNAILGKRQEYLVKILKEKDMEIEKLITCRKCIS